MTNDRISSDFGQLWRSQATESPRISSEDLRRRMRKFERKIFWRNIVEYAAGAVGIATYGYYEWKFPGLLLRIGSALVILGTLYVMYQLHRRASAEPVLADLGRSTYVEFHQSQLVRQRDALRAIWSWYLLPFIPGFAVFLAGMTRSAMARAQATGHPLSALQVAGFVGGATCFLTVLFVGIWLFNRWAANKLQAKIDELEALAQEPKK
jgi:hypothetical protein